MEKNFRSISRKLFSKGAAPYPLVLLADCLIVLFAAYVARVHDMGFEQLASELWPYTYTNLIYLVGFLVGFQLMRTYRGILRYSSFADLGRIAVANFVGISITFIVRHITPIDNVLLGIKWQELVITFIIATALMWGLRIAMKFFYEYLYYSTSTQKVFIYGTYTGGVAIAKSLKVTEKGTYTVGGFVTDNPSKAGHIVMGAKVFYNDDNLVPLMKSQKVSILMVPPVKIEDLRNNQEMIDALAEAGIKIMVYSEQQWDGTSSIRKSQLKEISIEDLLPRDQIDINLHAISEILEGKSVLITGAAGSIGSEIVRQVASFHPSQMVLVDQAETPLHDIRLMMAKQYENVPCKTFTMSICNVGHMESLFRRYAPQYVFHAAAYKHVPMMEDNPTEAVANNIDGTRFIADLSVKYGVRKFVMISTDKAVNPTNVMGCSKRICEMYCQSLNKAIVDGKVQGVTQFVTTRFGNVLGSNGSVIPLFKEQIKNGGPLTVTHPKIIRYFMLIPEACKLVLQAGTMGHGGEIFVFDMGKPVRIADLAKRMINLSGATDIDIVYTGLRDGEKLYEELLNNEENTVPSSHPKIKIAQVRELGYEEICQQIDRLVEVTKQSFDDMAIVRQMKVIVPEFKSMNSIYQSLD